MQAKLTGLALPAVMYATLLSKVLIAALIEVLENHVGVGDQPGLNAPDIFIEVAVTVSARSEPALRPMKARPSPRVATKDRRLIFFIKKLVSGGRVASVAHHEQPGAVRDCFFI